MDEQPNGGVGAQPQEEAFDMQEKESFGEKRGFWMKHSFSLSFMLFGMIFGGAMAQFLAGWREAGMLLGIVVGWLVGAALDRGRKQAK